MEKRKWRAGKKDPTFPGLLAKIFQGKPIHLPFLNFLFFFLLHSILYTYTCTSPSNALPKKWGQESYLNYFTGKSCGPRGLARSNMSTHILSSDVFRNELPQSDLVVRRIQTDKSVYICMYMNSYISLMLLLEIVNSKWWRWVKIGKWLLKNVWYTKNVYAGIIMWPPQFHSPKNQKYLKM